MLTWTDKTPTEIGWYWKRSTKGFNIDADIVYIRNYAGRLSIMNWDIPTENTLWAGPIPEPKGGGAK